VSPLIIVGIAVAVLMIAGAAVALLTGGRQQVDARMEQFVAGSSVFEPELDEADLARPDLADRLDKAMSGRGFTQRIRTRISRSDVKLRVSEYFVLRIAATVGVGLLVNFIFPGGPIVAVPAAILGSFIPPVYLNMAANRRLRAFENQLSDTLNLWVNALRSGYSVLQAMEAVATELPAPVSTEFERVIQEVRLGLSMEAGLNNMLRRMPSEDLDLVVTAVNIQREVGGNLAEVLDIISFTIRERVRIKGEIRTLTAQGRISGYVISFLPIALFFALMGLNPDYGGQLLVREPPIILDILPCGWLVIFIALVMIGIGWFAIQKIVDIEV
jgi:tight adherence protein B